MLVGKVGLSSSYLVGLGLVDPGKTKEDWRGREEETEGSYAFNVMVLSIPMLKGLAAILSSKLNADEY